VANILCVDDDPEIIRIKRPILEGAGHTMTACTSAAAAIEALQTGSFDAVVTDWRLGGDSGRSVVQAARRTSQLAVPVIVISGYVAEAFQAAEPLADLYLEKPADPRELVQVLEALLRARAAAEE
jgi:DNA-binding response OmpR family regulator